MELTGFLLQGQSVMSKPLPPEKKKTTTPHCVLEILQSNYVKAAFAKYLLCLE